MRSRAKIRAFDAGSLKILEGLCETTWLIFEARHPFRDTSKDDERRSQLRLKLFIHAENFGLEELAAGQRLVLETMSREAGLTYQS
jgi:hypothetical protein